MGRGPGILVHEANVILNLAGGEGMPRFVRGRNDELLEADLFPSPFLCQLPRVRPSQLQPPCPEPKLTSISIFPCSWAVVTLPISAPRSRPPSLVTSPRSTPPTSPTLTDYSVMVTDRLGPNLETIFAQKGRRFRLEALLGIAVQLIERVEFIHSRGYLHR